MSEQGYHVAILGATGAVGTRIIEQLENSNINVASLKPLASKHSAGKTVTFNGQTVEIEEATPESFEGIDIVLASAGGAVSKELLPEAVKRGAVCVDNTSAFRMDENVPLVVPEVNADQLKNHHGIIANPNCSTIQMMVALEPIRRKYGLKQIITSTYQAASGSGQAAIDELIEQVKTYVKGEEMSADIMPVKSDKKHFPLAFNLLPQIDVFEEDGYSHEEWKMIHETKKIMKNDMNDTELKVTATCVRVPVVIGHGESVYFEMDNQDVTADDIKELLSHSPGVIVEDNPAEQLYPQPLTAEGKRETFVGRIRPDKENPGAFNMWIVSDNLLKGAAWNTVQIAEELVKRRLIK
ncbi:aspartate-semialdehyde dehydrogenase [Holzapfeliella floricola]|uniref:Aspartate-semialdehyde dehydrogenase n=1 Tax=Holzapfeliella floricola DSM 23037 = JCM 16512 TaxID=1423744 RepID=A0A0R2DHM6_9LACO|nr:aspartate-semialdehyde dehydrogenase [Holzapfeliella floricola]KRN03550.1 aspartate-semialdehyde dehydrogenase [Holzapfeliella floricola DSM 23037 = JCM 16512]